jgi:hypothetical protein
MITIGLLSDTHGFLDPALLRHFEACDEIWHAGDLGEGVAEALEAFRPLRAVHGNIDGPPLQWRYPEHLHFECHGLRVWITHIGGFPPKYTPAVKKGLDAHRPGLFVCGHSHILRVIGDPGRKLYHFNPGAAGHHGLHQIRTALLFQIHEGQVRDLKAIELGRRGQIGNKK